MKTKYVIIQLGLVALGSTLIFAVPKVEIEGNKIVHKGDITVADVGDKNTLDQVKKLADVIKGFRNAESTSGVENAVGNAIALLEKIYSNQNKEKIKILPWNIGKKFNEGMAHILFSLSYLKGFKSVEVGLAKSFGAAIILASILDIFSKKLSSSEVKQVLDQKTSCSFRSEYSNPNASCAFKASFGSKKITMIDSALNSGNFAVLELLTELFFGTDKSYGDFVAKLKTIYDNFKKVDSKDLRGIKTVNDLNEKITKEFLGKAGQKLNKEFIIAVGNFAKLTKLK